MSEHLNRFCLQSVCTHILIRRECWECIRIADPKANRKNRGYVLANLSWRGCIASRGIVPVCFRSHFYSLKIFCMASWRWISGSAMEKCGIPSAAKARACFQTATEEGAADVHCRWHREGQPYWWVQLVGAAAPGRQAWGIAAGFVHGVTEQNQEGRFWSHWLL